MNLQIIYVLIIVVLLFGATIFAHELGHFIVARLLHMVVDVFSIGFGPAIWKKKIGNVVYQIAGIPIGGYVALPQMDPQLASSTPKTESSESDDKSVSSRRERNLPKLAAWKKLMVAVSGPVGNILLAVLLAWIVYWVGKPSTPSERSAVVGFVEPDSSAYYAGIRIGDEIIAVNERRVSNWHEFLQENARFNDVELTLKRDDDIKNISVFTARNAIGLRAIEGLRDKSICKIQEVDPGSSADIAGLMSGDIIKFFDGVEVLSVEQLIMLVADRPDEQTTITIDRKGETMRFRVTPRIHSELNRAVIGIRFDPMAFDYDQKVHIRPSVQLKHHATMILRVVRSLITPSEAKATSEGLGGPFMIIFMFVEMVRRSFITALWFTCFLNVNLAILNLLPIPILDGGHVVFSLWEIITRRPVYPKVVIWLSNLFAGLLILVFVLLTWRDLQRIFKLRQLFSSTAPQHEPANNAPDDVEP